jgi:OmcA/MtrC family decaheme c-type cytochrome
MKMFASLRRLAQFVLLGALAALASLAHGQTPLAWEQTKYFQYNIDNVTVTNAGSGSWAVKVIFSVSNPIQMDEWDIKAASPFQSAGANLTLDIGWNPGTDFTNTGSANPTLTPVTSTALGTGAAIPVQVRGLQVASPTAVASPCASATDCPGVASLVRRYWVSKIVTPVPSTVAAGRLAIEGRPVCNGLPNCPTTVAPFANIPVRSATADFAFKTSNAAMIPNARRQVVDIAKCQGCHDDGKHGDTVVPRLSLHGANRNENLNLCVVCHNPNQTDVPYRYLSDADPRIGGPETPIDFKVMVHSIHAGGFRNTPFVVIGFNSSVNDFSGVRFPAELRKSCLKCHVDINGKGTFELPLNASVLGTTIKTQSTYQVATGALRTIDVDPANDLKISPTAAVCSSCHDNSEVRSHMIRTGGASFATTQAQIGKTVVERCANCHGPGKKMDVRKAHEIGGG